MAECGFCNGTAVDRCLDCSRRICKRHRDRTGGEIRCSGCAREDRRKKRKQIEDRPGNGDPELMGMKVLPSGKTAWMQRGRNQ